MKNTIILLFFYIFVSCQDTTEVKELIEKSNEQDVIISDPVINAMLDGNIFKEFLVAVSQEKPSSFYWKHKGFVNEKNEEKFSNRYESFKKDMLAVENGGNIDECSEDIQSIALRLLRRRFLLKEDEASLQECIWLFSVLKQHKSVDMDVLVDTYLKIKDRLPEADRKEAYDFIKDLYFRFKIENEEQEYLNVDEVRKKLDEGGITQAEFLSIKIAASTYLNKARAIEYGNSKLGFETQNLD